MEVVLVTGAGGPAGVAIIQALQPRHRVIAVDADPDAAGLFLADAAAIVPLAHEPGFAKTIADVAAQHEATTLISTIPAEMSVLTDIDIPHWFPSPATLRLCADKWLFYQTMRRFGIPTPISTSKPNGRIPGPWVIKPRSGSGGRGVRFVDDPYLARRLFKPGDDIMQTHQSGREFTADCLVGHHGELVACITRWRNETRGGISVKGETFVSVAVTMTCRNVLNAIRLTGIANVQGFVNDGGTVITECNPRFSGGLPLTIAAGADLPNEYVRMIHTDEVPVITFDPGIRMTRYFANIFQ